VRKTHKIPLSTSLGSRQGRPLPSARRGGTGTKGFRISHCSSVRSTSHLRQRKAGRDHFTVYEMASSLYTIPEQQLTTAGYVESVNTA
jgi:hypothetical protein